jgi:hypothetical protein
VINSIDTQIKKILNGESLIEKHETNYNILLPKKTIKIIKHSKNYEEYKTDYIQNIDSEVQLNIYINKLIEFEQPIHQSIIDKRIRSAFKLTKIGSNVRERIKNVLKRYRHTSCQEEVFYWKAYQSKLDYSRCNSNREIMQIPFEEIFVVISDYLKTYEKIEINDMIHLIADEYNCGTVREKNNNYLLNAIQYAVQNDERITIVKDVIIYKRNEIHS